MFAQVQTRVLNRDRLHPPAKNPLTVNSDTDAGLMGVWSMCRDVCVKMMTVSLLSSAFYNLRKHKHK